jgi:hypothetical protein
MPMLLEAQCNLMRARSEVAVSEVVAAKGIMWARLWRGVRYWGYGGRHEVEGV